MADNTLAASVDRERSMDKKNCRLWNRTDTTRDSNVKITGPEARGDAMSEKVSSEKKRGTIISEEFDKGVKCDKKWINLKEMIIILCDTP